MVAMTDIKQLIEEEAHKYGESCIGNSYVKFKADNGFKAGASLILSKWQEATRWRKFGTDDLPEIGQQIVCKDSKNELHLSKPRSHDGIHWLAENFVEWMPITEIEYINQ